MGGCANPLVKTLILMPELMYYAGLQHQNSKCLVAWVNQRKVCDPNSVNYHVLAFISPQNKSALVEVSTLPTVWISKQITIAWLQLSTYPKS